MPQHHVNGVHFVSTDEQFDAILALRTRAEKAEAALAEMTKDRDNSLAISQSSHRQWEAAEAALAESKAINLRLLDKVQENEAAEAALTEARGALERVERRMWDSASDLRSTIGKIKDGA